MTRALGAWQVYVCWQPPLGGQGSLSLGGPPQAVQRRSRQDSTALRPYEQSSGWQHNG